MVYGHYKKHIPCKITVMFTLVYINHDFKA